MRLQTQFSQSCSDTIHLIGFGPRFDDRGNERRELWRRPAVFLGKLGMNEIQPEEWVILVFDTAIHMSAAPVQAYR